MLTRLTRIICDQCGTTVTLGTGDTLEAERVAEKRGWVEHDWDTYGNRGHFCGVRCRDVMVERLETENHEGEKSNAN